MSYAKEKDKRRTELHLYWSMIDRMNVITAMKIEDKRCTA